MGTGQQDDKGQDDLPTQPSGIGSARTCYEMTMPYGTNIGLFKLWLALAVALQLALPGHVSGQGQQGKDSFVVLQQWLLARGGKLDARVCINAQGLRGLCSSKDVRKGQTLVEVPAQGLITCKRVQDCTMALYQELQNQSSDLRPYLDLLPQPGQVLSKCNLPRELFPLLESDWLEADVVRVQSQLGSVLSNLTAQASPSGPAITMQTVQHMCAVASTRTIWDGSRGLNVLMPVIDLLNHRQGCSHTVATWDTKTCQPSDMHSRPEHLRYVLRAGEDVAAGQELCYSYSDTARADAFLLSWGFIPSLPPGTYPQLLTVDDFQTIGMKDRSTPPPALPLELPTWVMELPAWVGGRRAGELARLQSLLDQLESSSRNSGGGGSSSSGGSSSDGSSGDGSSSPAVELKRQRPQDGWMVDLLVKLQEHRRAALRHEIARLAALERDGSGWWTVPSTLLKTACAVVAGVVVVLGLTAAVEVFLAGTTTVYRLCCQCW